VPEELEEEVQDRGVALTNRDNIIDNLQAKIHELQQHQAPAPATPTEDVDPTSDINESWILSHFVMILTAHFSFDI
jgi:hypothetical protein